MKFTEMIDLTALNPSENKLSGLFDNRIGQIHHISYIPEVTEYKKNGEIPEEGEVASEDGLEINKMSLDKPKKQKLVIKKK